MSERIYSDEERAARKKASDAAYRERNREAVRARNKKWAEENPRKVSASKAKWYEGNRAKALATSKEWAGKNKERHSIKAAEWRAENREKTNASQRKWLAKNKDKAKESTAKWRAENKENVVATRSVYLANNLDKYRIWNNNRRARLNANGGRLSAGLVGRLMLLQRGKCACCHADLLVTGSHLDHVMPLALDGANTDSNTQLLCPDCNQQKHAKHPVDFMQQRGYLL